MNRRPKQPVDTFGEPVRKLSADEVRKGLDSRFNVYRDEEAEACAKIAEQVMRKYGGDRGDAAYEVMTGIYQRIRDRRSAPAKEQGE